MRGKQVSILAVAVGGLIALLYWLWPAAPVKNFPSKNDGPIVFFGDSLVEGVGAREGGDLPTRVSTRLGVPVRNFGMAGDLSVDGLERVDQAAQLRPRIAVVILGGNDFLRKVPREETAVNLEKIVLAFQEEGAVVLLIGVRSGIIGGGADELFEGVAEKTGAAYEEDILQGVFGDPALMSDAIHPNDAGYAKITERLVPVIQTLLK